jgi:hypothetical protein
MALPACRIYVHDVAAGSAWASANSSLRAPSGWENRVRGPQELWAQRALANPHPWRVQRMEEADLVIFSANFSLMCLAYKMVYGLYNLWAHLEQTAPHLLNELPAKGVFLETGCKVPWSVSHKRRIGHVSRVRDVAASYMDVVAPAVVATQHYHLASAADGQSALQNHHDRLLFFAGHIPKLYLSKLRWEIWKQVRSVPDVTAISHTVNCTVLAWASICQDEQRLSDGVSHETFCRAACPGQPKRGSVGAACSRDARSLRSACQKGKFKSVDLVTEYAALAKNNGRAAAFQSPQEYAQHLMSHRFCLAAPGDGLATPKATEFVMAAAAGGCVPIFVVPDCKSCTAMAWRVRVTDSIQDRWNRLPTATRSGISASQLAIMEAHMARILPFSRWRLDYCKLGFILPATVARKNMSSALRLLREVTDDDLRRKQESCVEAATVFEYRSDDRMLTQAAARPPGAVSHIISELCQVSGGGLRNVTVPPLDASCLLY